MRNHEIIFIKNSRILTPFEEIESGTLLVENGRIAQIGTITPPKEANIIDAEGNYLAPGFIDLQLNGAFGYDFTTQSEHIWQVATRLPRYGVTSFLPTIVTSPPERIIAAQSVLARGCKPEAVGAKPLGLHIEGPFFNPQKKGAHNPSLLRKPTLEAVVNWTRDQHVRLVTLAPELSNALPVIEQLVAQGVVVSAGHSMATIEEARAGFAAGIQYGTHLFNAMPPLHHRHPGLIGALLDNDHCVLGIIPDAIHVHPSLVKLVWQIKGPRGLNLVTDAAAALGMPPGQFTIGNRKITVTDRDVRLVDGTLAGSVLSLDQAIRNLMHFTEATLQNVLPTVTSTPANLLGIGSEIGRIAPGFLADLVMLDEDYSVLMTIVNGEIVYTSS